MYYNHKIMPPISDGWFLTNKKNKDIIFTSSLRTSNIHSKSFCSFSYYIIIAVRHLLVSCNISPATNLVYCLLVHCYQGNFYNNGPANNTPSWWLVHCYQGNFYFSKEK